MFYLIEWAGARFMLLLDANDNRSEDSVKNFFQDIYESYIKVSWMPLFLYATLFVYDVLIIQPLNHALHINVPYHARARLEQRLFSVSLAPSSS